MDLLSIYHTSIPDFIKELMQTKEMLRLKDVGMHCGCEYSSFPAYASLRKYSRYEHSIGVALIVWHFTKDIKQSIAGLLHDISTPTFAHVIDFLNKDYEKQESTEELTHEMIEKSKEIQDILKKYNLVTTDVDDYHLYSIADNDAPKLSADRLEYTLGNFYSRRLKTKEEIQRIYNNIFVSINSDNELELAFSDVQIAKEFTLYALNNSRYYIDNQDRFAMQYVADILQFAITKKVITKQDLYQDETHVISLLNGNIETKKYWQQYKDFKDILIYENEQDFYCVKVQAKKRYINPLVNTTRITTLSKSVNTEIESFLAISFDYWISEKSLIK